MRDVAAKGSPLRIRTSASFPLSRLPTRSATPRICAAVSVVLVVSYMRLVAGVRFSLSFVALAQAVYLVGFSYAFFWKGYTGLTVVVGAILTLFLLMQSTGRVKWHGVFGRAAATETPPPPPVQP